METDGPPTQATTSNLPLVNSVMTEMETDGPPTQSDFDRLLPSTDPVDINRGIDDWASSLEGPHLDLMVSLKQLAEVRLVSTGEKSLSSCLTPASLRTIGIILEELIKDRMRMEYPSASQDLMQVHGDAQS